MKPPDSTMLQTFSVLTNSIKIRVSRVSIDNLIFKLHYRVTFLVFLTATILVTSQQYIGEHIRCIAGDQKSPPENVINTFCFFTSTYTVVRHLNESSLISGLIPHPGVGPIPHFNEEPTIKHAYYQWVPFVLFFQAFMFYVPHMIWKNKEGGRIRQLSHKLQLAALALHDKPYDLEGLKIPSQDDKKKVFAIVTQTFTDKIHNKPWTRWLIICEFLNLFNVIVNVYGTHIFLGHNFLKLGPQIYTYGLDSGVDILDEVFPKVTKCDFYKYGASGSIQKHDALCVMALNIINEKIYVFLWFWFVILFIFSTINIVWRLSGFCLHKIIFLNKIIFRNVSLGTVNDQHIKIIVENEKCDYANWLFLYYLGSNMDGHVFAEFVNYLADRLSPQYFKGEGNSEEHKLLKDA